MSIKMITKDEWLVQVQRGGKRKTKRGTGGESVAQRAEAKLVAELESEVELDDAARKLGVVRTAKVHKASHAIRPPTLREYFEKRWVEHAKVVQNETTRLKSEFPFKYLIYYLGEYRLDELLEPAVINDFVEKMKTRGPISFATRKDGQPWRTSSTELTNCTINKSLISRSRSCARCSIWRTRRR
jgi:hypothetical protein